jgi:hypothetical protein
MEAQMTRLVICICAIAGVASSAAAGPLQDAVKDGDIARVKLLIAQGADVNKVAGGAEPMGSDRTTKIKR